MTNVSEKQLPHQRCATLLPPGAREGSFARRLVPSTRFSRQLLAVFLLLSPAAMTTAYEFLGTTWPVPRTIFYVDIPGANGRWSSAFEQSMNKWNVNTDFEFQAVRRYVDPCNDPNVETARNSVDFASANCDESFGSALAVMTGFSSAAPPFVQTRIMFNSDVRWGLYDGPTRGNSFGVFDFRRVALHELGHALGLAHEDTVVSIMGSNDSDVFALQPDDLAAVAALYGPEGPNPDRDDHGDWPGTARPIDPDSITPGRFEDDEDQDFFRIRLPTSGFLNIGTTGTQDTEGFLYDSDLNGVDGNNDASAGNRNFNIAVNLDAGTYYLWLRPFSDPETGVGISGDGRYSLFSEFFQDSVPAVSRVGLTGTVIDQNGDSLCAMVLASGVYQFTCNPRGPYELQELPREITGPNVGKVKRAVYADGYYPRVHVMDDSLEETIVMRRARDCPSYGGSYNPAVNPSSEGKWIDISGRVYKQLSRDPVCAMVLANGQHTFSCDATGSYSLNIPLDANGQYKLAVYAQGFAPKVQLFDESRPSNAVRMTPAAECTP